MMKTEKKSYCRRLLVLFGLALIISAVVFFTLYPKEDNKPTQPESVTPSIEKPDDYTLRLLVWGEYAPEKHVNDFIKDVEKQYKTKIEFVIIKAKSNDDFFEAIRKGKVDLVTFAHYMLKDERFQYIKNKLLLPFDIKNIPNYSNVIPELKESSFIFTENKVYGIPFERGSYKLLYNTAKFDQEPKSWEIFWDPAYKKKYSIGATDYLYNVNITALALGYPREDIGDFNKLNNKTFKTKLRELAVNAHSMWVGVDQGSDLIDLDFAAGWGTSLSSLEKMGKHWKEASPEEGVMHYFSVYAATSALKDRPFMKKIAEEWINYVLLPDFQVNHITRELKCFLVIKNITEILTEKEKEHFHKYTRGSNTKNRIQQMSYSIRNRNGIRELWDKAMEGVKVKGNEGD